MDNGTLIALGVILAAIGIWVLVLFGSNAI